MSKTINMVIIGNIAYDTNFFYYKDKVIEKRNCGGACLYSALAASLYTKVGLVGCVGDDFDTSIFTNYNSVDLRGLKIKKNEITTEFIQYYPNEFNRKERKVLEKINSNLNIELKDIPKEYLKSKYIHLTTNYPKEQLKYIKYIRENSNAIISVDTIEGYSKIEETKEVFDLVDIAFIDEKFENLINCKAPLKIIKNGKYGCTIIEKNKKTILKSEVKDNVVDKTGAGDCLNGAFIANLSNGLSIEDSLKEAIKLASYSIDYYGMNDIYKYNKGE